MSAAGRRAVTHSQEQTDVPAAWEHMSHMWPSNSSDLKPVDCAAWGALQQMVYQCRRVKTINQLKQANVTEWGKLLECFIDGATGQWHHRLEWVVLQQGEQIEHLM